MLKLAPIFVIVAAILWGIDGIILRPSLYSLPVPLVVFIESAIVAIILSPIFMRRYKNITRIDKKDLVAFLGVALFGGAIGTMAITKALFFVNFVNLSIVILLQKLQPVFALILAMIFLKEKLPKIFFLWAVTAIIGAYFLTFGTRMPNLDTGEETVYAALFALLAAFSFAFSTVLSKRALRNVSFELGTYLRFLVTTIIMFFIVSATGDLTKIGEVSTQQILIFLLIAFTTGGLAIFLYYYGLKNISASVATICELAFPLTAVLLEFLLHDKLLDGVQWIGGLILILSIVRVTRLSQERIRKSKLSN
ncbi:MAG: DMT family transporter [Melioribacteraceae bacterium]|nr:DMT family transporter [Melioribacteraceae bacterium]MCF8356850.1 DMT family transporter [Melioribacteraceae bacterium]MCF8396229.1 DMT family transporter [Melioribacteraceae bacterium]MCF8421152.1 DMT family transporter [Melioribacteraceae bacterium]